jgi:hypothetical protein
MQIGYCTKTRFAAVYLASPSVSPTSTVQFPPQLMRERKPRPPPGRGFTLGHRPQQQREALGEGDSGDSLRRPAVALKSPPLFVSRWPIYWILVSPTDRACSGARRCVNPSGDAAAEGWRLLGNIAADQANAAEQRDPRVRRGCEYDEFYRTLELPPGAPLADVDAAASLLRVAFEPDGVPDHLKRQAEIREMAVDRAVSELRYFWRTYGETPPSADLSKAGGLFDALVEALEESAAAVTKSVTIDKVVLAPTLAQPADTWRVALDRSGAESTPGVIRMPAPTPPVPPREHPPVRRLHRIELASVLLRNEIFKASAQSAIEALAAPRLPLALPALPAPRPATPAPRPSTPPSVTLSVPPPITSTPPRRSVPLGLRGIALRAGVAGLALAFGFLLQYYGPGLILFAAVYPHNTANSVSPVR